MGKTFFNKGYSLRAVLQAQIKRTMSWKSHLRPMSNSVYKGPMNRKIGHKQFQSLEKQIKKA